MRPKSQNYHNWSTIGQSGQALSSCIVKWPSPQSKAICINSGQEKPKQRSSANLTCLPKIHEAILLISRPDLIMVNLPQFAFLCNIYHRAFPPWNHGEGIIRKNPLKNHGVMAWCHVPFLTACGRSYQPQLGEPYKNPSKCIHLILHNCMNDSLTPLIHG